MGFAIRAAVESTRQAVNQVHRFLVSKEEV